MAYRYAEDLDNTEKIFNVFSNCLAYTWCENPDYWWITDLCGPEKALEMEREFFDALSSVAITGRYEECSEEYSLDEEDCLLW